MGEKYATMEHVDDLLDVAKNILDGIETNDLPEYRTAKYTEAMAYATIAQAVYLGKIAKHIQSLDEKGIVVYEGDTERF